MSEIIQPRIGNRAPDWGADYGIKELWSEVLPGLWVGGTHDDDTVADARDGLKARWNLNLADAEITKDDFDAVVTLYAWAQPVDWEVEELRTGIYDDRNGISDEHLELVREAAAFAHKRWLAGKRVLIRCQAGLNRSSLVTAFLLLKEGYTAEEAIKLIRAKRSHKALFNDAFVGYVVDEWEAQEEVVA